MRREKLELSLARSGKVRAQVTHHTVKGNSTIETNRIGQGPAYMWRVEWKIASARPSVIPSPGIHTLVPSPSFECGMKQGTCF